MIQTSSTVSFVRTSILALATVSLFAITPAMANSSATSMKATQKSAAKRKPAQEASQNASSNSSSSANTSSASMGQKAISALSNKAQTEYAFHTAPKTHLLIANLSSSNLDTSVKPKNSGKSSSTEKSNLINLLYVRGLENDMNISIESFLGNKTVDFTGNSRDAEYSGMGDMTFKVQKLSDSNRGQMFYGGKFVLSPGTHEIAYDYDNGGNKASRTGNLYSGGHTLGAYVGLQKQSAKFNYGGKVGLDLALNRESNGKSSSGSYTIETTGGNTFSGEAFIEMPNNKGVFGAKAGLDLVSDTSYSIKTENQAAQSYSTDQATLLGFGLYGKYPINQRVELLPEMRHQRLIGGGGGSMEISDYQNTSLILNTRIAL